MDQHVAIGNFEEVVANVRRPQPDRKRSNSFPHLSMTKTGTFVVDLTAELPQHPKRGQNAQDTG